MIGILDNEERRIRDFTKYAGDILPEKKIRELAETGYFYLPASILYHGQQEGDLYLHSKTVATLLEELTERNGLTWQRPQSPRIIGLFHDLCKTQEYEWYKACGAEDKVSFHKRLDILLPGHGEKSVQIAQKFVDMTDEEMFCIRYHMGAFEGKDVWKYLERAAAKYPNILWTAHADLMAAWICKV